MTPADDLMRENQALRERLSRLSEASLRINESLDPDTVLQEVMDNARTLTAARFGAITTLDDDGGLLDFITSGLSPEEREGYAGAERGTEAVRVLQLGAGASAAAGRGGPHEGAGLSGGPPAGEEPHGDADAPPGGARGQPLRRREGGRRRVHP